MPLQVRWAELTAFLGGDGGWDNTSGKIYIALSHSITHYILKIEDEITKIPVLVLCNG